MRTKRRKGGGRETEKAGKGRRESRREQTAEGAREDEEKEEIQIL